MEDGPTRRQDVHRFRELEVVDVTEDDDVGVCIDGEDRVDEVVEDLRLLMALDLGATVRRLEPPEQRLVGALRVEVVGDQEERLAAVGELAREWLAASVPRGIRRSRLDRG